MKNIKKRGERCIHFKQNIINVNYVTLMMYNFCEDLKIEFG